MKKLGIKEIMRFDINKSKLKRIVKYYYSLSNILEDISNKETGETKISSQALAELFKVKATKLKLISSPESIATP